MSDEQAATETVEPAESQPTEAGSEPSIDELLAEFDSETKPTPSPEPEAKTDEVEALKARVAQMEQKTSDEQNISAISKLNVEGLDKFDTTDVYDWMRIQASRDPRIDNAYENRHQNPAAWEKVLEGMGKQFVDKFSTPDTQLTADREAVNTAVKGQSNAPAPVTAPTNEELDNMSDQEIMKLANGA